jgi:hypothetical protein
MSTDLFDRYATLDPANSPQAAPDWASTAPVLLAAIDERTTQMQTPDALDIPTEPKTRRNGMLIAAAVFAIVVIAGAVLAIVSTRGEPQPAAPIPEPTQLRVIWDGESCTFEGPTDLNAGSVTLQRVNESEEEYIVNLALLDEGKTLQDAIDDAGPLPSFGIQPSWAHAMVPELDIQPGESVSWEGDLEAGIYAIACSARVPPTDPKVFNDPWAVRSITGFTVEG